MDKPQLQPLNTFFRISPSLLGPVATTPLSRRASSSSSFSSPSFAEHQTGLKIYRGGIPAPTFDIIKQATDDHANPLFEGFPALTQREGSPADGLATAASAASACQAGEHVKLEEQLQSLLSLLQARSDLPHGSATNLADELEAVAKKLKEKEREADWLQHEVQVERQMRAKMQLALTGAEATIRKLRVAPTPQTAAAAGARRCSEPGGGDGAASGMGGHSPDVWPAAGSASASTSSRSLSLAGGIGGHDGGMRDSVCKQLLQSPASTLSPLSFAHPAAASGCSPLSQTDAACMVSPKELPGDTIGRGGVRQRVLRHSLRAPDEHLPPSSTSPQAFPQTSEPAADSLHQQLLSTWMLSALATPTSKPDAVAARGAGGGGGRGAVGRVGRTTAAALAELQTPAPGGAGGVGLAAAVRAALAASPAPSLVYGSPLHLKIQRLLALEQRAPSPLAQLPSSVPASSCPSSLTSTACETPVTASLVDLEALAQFRSSVSPFGPTLRQRFATGAASASAGGSADSAMPTAAPPAAPSTTSQPSFSGTFPTPPPASTLPSSSYRQQRQSPLPLSDAADQAEVAELVSQLGLDLDLAAAGDVSQLDVLSEIDRWLSLQYMAAKNAMLTGAKPYAVCDYDDSGEEEEGAVQQVDGSAFNGQVAGAVVEAGIQTEAEGVSGSVLAAAARRGVVGVTGRGDAAMGTGTSPARSSADAVVQVAAGSTPCCGSKHAVLHPAARRASDDDVLSPGLDQAKRSPAAAKDKAKRAEATPPAHTHVSSATTPGSVVKRGSTSGTAPWTRWHQATADVSGTPARRGLFRDAQAARTAAALQDQATCAAAAADGGGGNSDLRRSVVAASGAAIADSILRGAAVVPASISLRTEAAIARHHNDIHDEEEDAGSAPAPPRAHQRKTDPFDGPSSSPASYGRITGLLAPPLTQGRPSAGGGQIDDELEEHLRAAKLTIRTSHSHLTLAATQQLQLPAALSHPPPQVFQQPVPSMGMGRVAPLPEAAVAAARAPFRSGPVHAATHVRQPCATVTGARALPSIANIETTEVLFTPGNGGGSGSRASGRHMSRVFPGVGAASGMGGGLRYDDSAAAGAHHGAANGSGGSISPVRPLSSISSVSIVTSEPGGQQQPTRSGGGGRERSSGGAMGSEQRSKASAATSATATSKPHKPLFGFFASLTSCTRGSDAY